MRPYFSVIVMCLFLQNCIADTDNPLGMGPLVAAISGQGGTSSVDAQGMKIQINQPKIHHSDTKTYIQSNVDSPHGTVATNSLGLDSKQ